VRILLTGATQGIGRATARLLCPLADVLLLHGLEPEAEAQPLLRELRALDPRTELVYLRADYDRLAEVAALADAVAARVDGLELLVNNAGRPGPARRTLSADGHEATFQTNFLAPVALTSALLPALARAADVRPAGASGAGARIVNVASATHYSASLRLDDLELEEGYGAVAAYAHSKLAVVTWTCWLAHRLDGERLDALSLHPGVISTDLLHAMFGAGGAAPERAAANVVAAAQRPRGINGAYLDEDEPARPNPEALDHAAQERLLTAAAEALTAAGLPDPRERRPVTPPG